MTGKAPISDFDFSQGSQELTPFDVPTLLREYADGRRKFNQIDLKNGNLSDAYLPYIHLEESLLQKADLRNAILAGASFNHTDLSSSNLAHANLIAADLIRAKLAGANLAGAFLSGVNLSGANLRRSNLTDCTMAGANLSGVDFTGAILKNTNLAGATLRGANLSSVDLSDLDLSELNLEGSILPADQGGATWIALQSGQPGDPTDLTTGLDPSQDLPSAYPIDAIDDSYEDLIQDLSEASDWSQSIDPEGMAALADMTDEALAQLDRADSVGDDDQLVEADPSFTVLAPVEQPNGTSPQAHADEAFGPLSDAAAETLIEATTPNRAEPVADDDEPESDVSFLGDESPRDSGVVSKGQYDPRQHPHQTWVVKSIQAVLNRRTHLSLQRKLLEVYGKRCAISGCSIVPLLDTVLIDSSDSSAADHPSNGLVLRSDIKILYDLHLIAIHPSQFTVMLAPSLRSSSYGYLQGQKIHLPKQAIYRPGPSYLHAHLDQCRWQGSDPEYPGAGVAVSAPASGVEERAQSVSGVIPKVAFLAAGMVLGMLLMGLLWTFLSSELMPNLVSSPSEDPDKIAAPASAEVPTVTVDPDHEISLQLGPLTYPKGGVIYNQSAYLSVVPLEQADLINAGAELADVISVGGEEYVKATYVQAPDREVNWNAETRTITLDCCADPEIEPIDIAIDGVSPSDQGLIIEGNAYVPVEVLEPLNLEQIQISGENYVRVDRQLMVRAGGLKPRGIQVVWDADTRTLNLAID